MTKDHVPKTQFQLKGVVLLKDILIFANPMDEGLSHFSWWAAWSTISWPQVQEDAATVHTRVVYICFPKVGSPIPITPQHECTLGAAQLRAQQLC